MSQPVVLEAARIEQAKLLLVTIPSVLVSQAIVKQVHRLKAKLHIVARAEEAEQMKSLYDEGVYMVVLPEMEAGLEIARQALLHLQMPVTVIQQYTDAVRQHLYAPIYRSSNDYNLLTKLDNVKDLLEIFWVKLTDGSPLIGITLKQSAMRTRTGASVVGVLRGGLFQANPAIDFCFGEGDLVAVVGNLQEIEAVRAMAKGGENNRVEAITG
jgi:CPA2 family monovalent cation:H+ antiporter-2